MEEKVKKMGLSLYKRFGFPEVKELGLNDTETVGEIYKIEKDKFSRVTDRQHLSGHGVVLFNRQDVEKLPKLEIEAIELIITDNGDVLIINHYF